MDSDWQFETDDATMGVQNDEYKTLEVTLTGINNNTLTGILNFTSVDLSQFGDEDELYDSKGAATFVVVVILVYGLSIVLMIGSLAKKNMQLKGVDQEEKQIHRYLNQASDLKEESAKENYRQLKKDIITLVKNTPDPQRRHIEQPVSVNDLASVSSTILRSMAAVGSPSAIEVAVPEKVPVALTLSDELQSPDSSQRKYSDGDSMNVLMEERESGDEAPPALGQQIRESPNVTIGPSPTIPMRTKLHVTPLQRYHPPTEYIATNPSPDSPTGINVFQPPTKQHTSDNAKRYIRPKPISIPQPRERESKSKYANKKEKSTDWDGYQDKNIYTRDGYQYQAPRIPGTLSADPDGHIWLLQGSPNSLRRIPNPVPPSPSISTPGSIGYESPGTSRTPSPSPVTTQPSGPSTGTRSRHTKPHSPAPVHKHRERSPLRYSESPYFVSIPGTSPRSPRAVSHNISGLLDRTQSENSTNPERISSPGSTIASMANTGTCGRKSPYQERKGYQRRYSGASTKSGQNNSYPSQSDSDELVQITTV